MSAEFWVNLQSHYDLALARSEFAETVAREVEAA
jgi:plasmid maintenance system antidote protein VapI